jgi:hypothetical protein
MADAPLIAPSQAGFSLFAPAQFALQRLRMAGSMAIFPGGRIEQA